MGRKYIKDIYKGIYHLILRGHNRTYVFKEPEDKAFLLNLISKAKLSMDFEFLGYVIMDNHYHLIIRRYTSPLSDIMKKINLSYSKYYNKKHHRTGSLFENRYKKYLVEDDLYLLSLLKYLHQNPVRAKMCDVIKEYKYSSDAIYRNNLNSPLVSTTYILNIISSNRLLTLKKYQSFMDHHHISDLKVFNIKTDQMLYDYLKLGEPPKKRIPLQTILEGICQHPDLKKKIKNNKRNRSLTPYKITFIQIASSEGYTLEAIGLFLNISKAAVHQLKQKGSNHGNYS